MAGGRLASPFFSPRGPRGGPADSIPAADAPAPAAPAEKIELRRDGQSGPVLTLDDAVRNGLLYHPSIKQAAERIGAQAAVVRQQLAAYYPTLSLNGQYQTGNQSGSTSVASSTSEFYQAQGSANMTLYNFGKREGAVQSARETPDPTRYNLKPTADTVVL